MGNWLRWSTETNLETAMDKDSIPLDRKLDPKLLRQMVVLTNKVDLVLRNLQNNNRYTWSD